MKLLFIIPFQHRYDSTTVRAMPMGGTEKSAMYLVEALRRIGHSAEIVTTWAETDAMDRTWPDVVVTQHAELFERFDRQIAKVWWCHQFTDRPFVWDAVKHVRRHATVVVTLSEFQRSDFAARLGLESVVIGSGVWHDEVSRRPKVPGRMIYTSVPQRGLDVVPMLFDAIRAVYPPTTLTVCSSLATWGLADGDADFAGLFEQLRRHDGVTLRGALGQAALYDELAAAVVFFYPATYPETFCVAMAEAMAHGCVPVIPEIGALPERWVSTDQLVHRAVQELQQFEVRPRRVRAPPDWMDVAEQWDCLLGDL